MKIILDSYTGSLVHLGVNKKEKIMKSMSFKSRDEMVKGLKSIKCGMDKLVESLSDKEAEYWEMKAEIYHGI